MKKLFATLLLGFVLFTQQALAGELKLTTGMVGGSYHDVLGVNLRNVMREQGVNMTVVPSRGSAENLERIFNGEAQVGFTQADALARWLRSNPTADIEILGSLGQECVFMATSDDNNLDRISRITDSGHRVAVGERGTGSALSWDYIRTLNDDYAQVQTFYQGGMRALAQVKTGQLDAFVWVTSPHNRDHRFFEAVNQDNSGLRFVNFNDRELRGELPNGETVYQTTDITIRSSTLGFGGVSVQAPCTGLMVVADYNLDSHILEELAYSIMMNGSRIKGK